MTSKQNANKDNKDTDADIKAWQMKPFPADAMCAAPVHYRTYSRRTVGDDGATLKEDPQQMFDRSFAGLLELGNYNPEQIELMAETICNWVTLPSGRWLWQGGTEWSKQQKNFPGSYNCVSTEVDCLDAFEWQMELAMMGCGTGVVLEEDIIAKLPKVINKLEVKIVVPLSANYDPNKGLKAGHEHRETTSITLKDRTVSKDNGILETVSLTVGDSREGWVRSYVELIKLACGESQPTAVGLMQDKEEQEDKDSLVGDAPASKTISVEIDLGCIRPAHSPIKGFGGVSQPSKLSSLYQKVTKVLNQALGRKLTSVECSKLIDEGAVVVVAGNVRRTAGMRQGSATDALFTVAKDNLWQQDEENNWHIDPERDALRMANHTRVFRTKPDYETVLEAVQKQYSSGEGAIQWAGEAVCRANADIVLDEVERLELLDIYNTGSEASLNEFISNKCNEHLGYMPDEKELKHRRHRLGLNPCFRGDMRLLTSEGYKTFKQLEEAGETHRFEAVAPDGTLHESKVWCSGVKDTVELKTNTGKRIFCTPDHVLMTANGKAQAKDCLGQILAPGLYAVQHIDAYVFGGYFFVDKAGKELEGTKVDIEKAGRQIIQVMENLGVSYSRCGEELALVRDQEDIYREMSCDFSGLSPKNQCAYICGLYRTHNSVVTSDKITFTTDQLPLAKQISSLMQSIGIENVVTEDTLQETFQVDIVDYESRCLFHNLIGFMDKVQQSKLRGYLLEQAPVVTSINPSGKACVYDFTVPDVHWGIVEGIVAHNCGEIIGTNYFCNLAEVHLSQLDPEDIEGQEKAFQAGALIVAALLKHEFLNERYRYSRELDPIVAVCPTGLFDFFVKLFGAEWIEWWHEGRPGGHPQANMWRQTEKYYLNFWRETVGNTLETYCREQGLKAPNRYTSFQPSGTKSLLTNSSPGWHPPFNKHWIRRIQFQREDPVALACIDFGYTVIPGQDDKDDSGTLLNDPYDHRVKNWLVEIPCKASWADMPNMDIIQDLDVPVEATFDFYMTVQKEYTQHNTSATILFRENEIEPLAKLIHKAIDQDEGYISAALLSRSEIPFPRMPFDAVSKEQYDELVKGVMQRRVSDDFGELMNKYFAGAAEDLQQDVNLIACDGMKCEMPVRK